MTPLKYCEEKAAIPGSNAYFSTRRLKAPYYEAIVAILAFYKEIEDITLLQTDPVIAHAKLNWWRDEVIKIQDGEPSHPVALALQQVLKPFSVSPLRLIGLIEGLEQNLTLPTFEKFEDVVIHIMRTAGIREILIAEILQKESSVPTETIYQFALVIELVNYLQNLRHYVRRGIFYFSEDELKQFGVQKELLQNFKTTPEIVKLLEFQAEKIRRAYDKAMEIKESMELKNLIIRSKVALAVLKTLQSENYRVLENFINITPLRCWWITWRG